MLVLVPNSPTSKEGLSAQWSIAIFFKDTWMTWHHSAIWLDVVRSCHTELKLNKHFTRLFPHVVNWLGKLKKRTIFRYMCIM